MIARTRAISRIGAWGALALAAAVQALSFGPYHHELLQVLSFAAALMLIDLQLRSSPLRFFFFHWLTLVIGLSWLHISMSRFGGMHPVLSMFALMGFCAYLASFGTVAFLLYRRFARRRLLRSSVAAGLCFGSLWGLFEIFRGLVFTGFPWLSVGYAHVDGFLKTWAPWVGVYGLSAWAVCTSTWLAGLLHSNQANRYSSLIAIALLAVSSSLIQSEAVQAIGPPLRSLLMQTNVSQHVKFNWERLKIQQSQVADMLASAQVDLSVSPETAWISPWAHSPPESRQDLLNVLGRQGGVLALGMPLGRAVEGSDTLPISTNSMLLLQAGGQVLGRYDKHHLVPFGEFVPPGFRWFVSQMNIPLGDFERGIQPAPVHAVAGRMVGFNICYEDLFPEEIARQVQQGAHVLVNASNLGWFGESHALHQHLQISRMRSLEMQRPMLRATNTGATAAIAADASVVAKLPYHREEVLIASVQPTTGLTAFARHGLIATLSLLGFMLVAGLGLGWLADAWSGRIKIRR